jgi:hypothetical protein
MISIDEFLIKENSKFIADLEEWKNEDGVSFEDGDMVRFKHEGKKYIGTLSKIGKEQNLFELIKVKEL